MKRTKLPKTNNFGGRECVIAKKNENKRLTPPQLSKQLKRLDKPKGDWHHQTIKQLC